MRFFFQDIFILVNQIPLFPKKILILDMLENRNSPKFIYLFHFIYLNYKIIYFNRLKCTQLIYYFVNYGYIKIFYYTKKTLIEEIKLKRVINIYNLVI